MSAKVEIRGSGRNNTAEIYGESRRGVNRPSGLVTYSVPYDFEQNAPRFAINDTFGNEMAQNGSDQVSATDGVHNGIDSVLWTAAAEAGTWTFNSTTQAETGTNSIDAENTVGDDSAVFTRASTIDPASYSQLRGAIYITSWSDSGIKDVQIEVLSSGSIVSATVNLSLYINVALINNWQEFTIPLSDLTIASSAIDGVRVRTIDVGAGPPPNYFLDNIQWELLTSGSITYSYGPERGEVYRARGVSWTIVNNFVPAASVGGALGLSYNQFAGLAQLPNGVLTQRLQDQGVLFSNSTRNISEIVNGPNKRLVEFWHDGTNTFLKFYNEFACPVELSGVEGDRYEFTVRDDLSSLVSFNIRLDGCLVTRQDLESISSNR